MTRRWSLALVTLLTLVLVSTGPVAARPRYFNADMPHDDCTVSGHMSWVYYPDKDYTLRMDFYQRVGSTDMLRFTDETLVSGKTGSFDGFVHTLTTDATGYLWYAEGYLLTTGKKAKVVGWDRSGSFTLNCS